MLCDFVLKSKACERYTYHSSTNTGLDSYILMLNRWLNGALANIVSSFGDIKSGRVMPWMASSERTGRAKRRIHRVPLFDVAITDPKMEASTITELFQYMLSP